MRNWIRIKFFRMAVVWIGLITPLCAEPHLWLKSKFSARVERVAQLTALKKFAEQNGIHIHLFGGTAASYLHYVLWDIRKEFRDPQIFTNRLDYHVENIFDPLQDIDLVVSMPNGKEEPADLLFKTSQFAKSLFRGRKIDVFGLKTRTENKPALLRDKDFYDQNSDSESTVLFNLNNDDEPIFDLKHPNDNGEFIIEKLLSEEISFYFSPNHSSTLRAQNNLNPPILSVIRILSKAFRYGIHLDLESERTIQSLIDEFDASKPLSDYSLSWLDRNIPKLFTYVADVEDAYQRAHQWKLIDKLLLLPISTSTKCLLRKFPLPSTHGSVLGKSDRVNSDTKLTEVTHATSREIARIMQWSPFGKPNIFISRKNHWPEQAAMGDGFYTSVGDTSRGNNGFSLVTFNVSKPPQQELDYEIFNDIVLWKTSAGLSLAYPNDLSTREPSGPEALNAFYEFGRFLSPLHEKITLAYLENQPAKEKILLGLHDPRRYFDRRLKGASLNLPEYLVFKRLPSLLESNGLQFETSDELTFIANWALKLSDEDLKESISFLASFLSKLAITNFFLIFSKLNLPTKEKNEIGSLLVQEYFKEGNPFSRKQRTNSKEMAPVHLDGILLNRLGDLPMAQETFRRMKSKGEILNMTLNSPYLDCRNRLMLLGWLVTKWRN